MSIELTIIKQFVDNKESFVKYDKYLRSVPVLDKELKLLINLIKLYYEKYDHDSIQVEDLLSFFDYNYPQNSGRGSFVELAQTLYEKDVKGVIVTDLMEQVMEKHYATKIVNSLLPVVEGNKYGVLPALRHDIDDFTSKLANPPVEQDGIEAFEMSIEELVTQEIDNTGIKWVLDGLNKVIGGVKEETLGLIYGFVDSGKTSLLLRQCGACAQQLRTTTDNIVYCGNEESAARLSLRLTQAMLGISTAQIRNKPNSAERRRSEMGFSRIKLFDSVSDTDHILRICDKYRPKVLFIDQATKVKRSGLTTKGDRDIEALSSLFNWYREKAKEYGCAIIGVAQGVGEAENKRWLNLSDIYGSRVAIQGELDYAIGIGQLKDDEAKENIRFIHIPKNKLYTGQYTKFTAVFRKEICQWEDG